MDQMSPLELHAKLMEHGEKCTECLAPLHALDDILGVEVHNNGKDQNTGIDRSQPGTPQG